MIRFLQAVDCFPKRVAKSTYFIFSSLTLFVSKQALVGYTDENWKSHIKNHELNFNHFLPFLKDLDKSSPHFLTWYLCAFKTDFTGLTENRISIGSQQSHNIPNGEGHQRISAVNKKIEFWMESHIHENRKTCKLGDFESETNTRCKSVRCLCFQNANTSHSKNIFGQLRW